MYVSAWPSGCGHGRVIRWSLTAQVRIRVEIFFFSFSAAARVQFVGRGSGVCSRMRFGEKCEIGVYGQAEITYIVNKSVELCGD